MEQVQGDGQGQGESIPLVKTNGPHQPGVCAQVEPLLSALLDGELPPVEHGRVEDHLRACPACRHTLVVFRAFGAGLTAALPAKAPRPAGADACPVCARSPH